MKKMTKINKSVSNVSRYILAVFIAMQYLFADSKPTLPVVSNFGDAKQINALGIQFYFPESSDPSKGPITVFVGGFVFDPATLTLTAETKPVPNSTGNFAILYKAALENKIAHFIVGNISLEDSQDLQKKLKAYQDEVNKAAQDKDALTKALKEVEDSWNDHVKDIKTANVEFNLKEVTLDGPFTQQQIEDPAKHTAGAFNFEIKVDDLSFDNYQIKDTKFMLNPLKEQSSTSAIGFKLAVKDEAKLKVVDANFDGSMVGNQAATELFKAFGGEEDVPFYKTWTFFVLMGVAVVLVVVLIICGLKSSSK